MTETERPDWLKPGAEVVVWSDNHGSLYGHVKRLQVLRVAGKSFTVNDDREPRFPIATCETRMGTTWNTYFRRVTPADSGQAREIYAVLAQRLVMSEARRAVEAWERKRTRETRLAAIAALQAVEVDEVPS